MSTTVGPTLIFQAVDLAGVLANGVLGGLLVRRLGFDPVGFVVLALISGLGGGVLRDLLLQVPPVALHNPAYLGVALAGAAIAFLASDEASFITGQILEVSGGARL
ncbi:TRIC cation channel family protein [Phycicoccus elongatus]|uniref:trimeric intracellular cation channel family protein n=1 Tax=Phycicoccus elongatus TaxID=101689 RepID=UPI0037842469